MLYETTFSDAGLFLNIYFINLITNNNVQILMLLVLFHKFFIIL